MTPIKIPNTDAFRRLSLFFKFLISGDRKLQRYTEQISSSTTTSTETLWLLSDSSPLSLLFGRRQWYSRRNCDKPITREGVIIK